LLNSLYYASEIIRLGGATRYETSVEVAKEIIDLGGNKLPIVTSGKEPVLYTATLANKYRSPIIYLDEPPVQESTFTPHGIVDGSIAIESFATWQTIRPKSPTYTMNIPIKTKGIKDAWMYVHTIGFDSVAEKWHVKMNDYTLTFRVHSKPIATHERSQLLRFDVGRYLKEGENKLEITGTDFNVDDQYYITGVTFVVIFDSDEKTEYWINEGNLSSFSRGLFGEAGDAKLYTLYLEPGKDGQVGLNNKLVDSQIISPSMLRSATLFSTILEADVSDEVEKENIITGPVPALCILEVASDDLIIPPAKIEKAKNPHQSYVEDYLNQEKFEQVGMVYYGDSIP